MRSSTASEARGRQAICTARGRSCNAPPCATPIRRPQPRATQRQQQQQQQHQQHQHQRQHQWQQLRARAALPLAPLSCSVAQRNRSFVARASVNDAATGASSAGDASASGVLAGKRIGFIGPGSMAQALAKGFVGSGAVPADRVGCSGSRSGRNAEFERFGAKAYGSNMELVQNSDIVFIAVKPYLVSKVIQEVKDALDGRHILVSIAAGVPIQTLLSAAGPKARVVRAMPNTPCLVGAAAAAMCLGGSAGPKDEAAVHALLSSVGKVFTVTEAQLSAVTGVSGSGPAYMFMIIEALADGGVKAGLPRDIAQALAAQTAMGAAKMVLETGKHPGQLKDMVTSPGGTTIAAVHELEKAGVRVAMMNAVEAAARRADELSKS